jgi:hypothetical protein
MAVGCSDVIGPFPAAARAGSGADIDLSFTLP